MQSNQHEHDLPKSVAQKLRAIRRRAIALTLLRGVVLTVAVLLGAMLAAMVVDWAAGWFDLRVRYAFTLLALGTAATAFAFWCVRPLARERTIVSTARDLDQAMPELEERWSTVTELSQNQDAPEVRGSEAMIQKVASEAELAGSAISPEAIVSARPVLRATRWLAGAAAVFALLFVINFTQAKLLAARFLMPGRNISLTQVSALPAEGWVAKGESLTLNAIIGGRVPNEPAKLFIRAEHGAAKEIAMKAKASPPGDAAASGSKASFQYVIDEVSDSFEYRVRSGDGQTAWHAIKAVDRPRISEVKLKVTPPAYSKLPNEEKSALPHAIRVLEGSEIEVGFRSDQPLDRMILDFGNGQPAQLAAAADNWYHFRSRPTNSFTFAAAAINKFKLENKSKPSCRVSVYQDLPPSVKILEPSDDLAVLPGEKVNVIFEAIDDLGLAKAEVIVATTKADGETNSIRIPVELDQQAGKKEFRKTVQLDPKAMGLKHGDELSYVVQVTDTKQTLASAESGSESQTQQTSAEQSLAESGETDSAGKQNQAEPAKSENGQEVAENSKSETEREHQEASESSSRNSQQSGKESELAAKSGKPNESDQKPNEGSQAPPNEMAMRMLDAGQISACETRNITVDEWAGTFEGERRKKLEIAIEPILKRLDELLTKAQAKNDSLKEPAASAQGLQPAEAEPLTAAIEYLAESERTIGEIKGRTSGTPYAFIGLQLNNIGDAHITPAHKALDEVLIPASNSSTNIAAIDKASFHISRAREMLADLTKTYETVKRDQQIADAMQKLNKMYQIFIEDTQALLGSSKGPLNSYDRKIAEVDDEFVEKLKELLEEKKKIMAELAKLLSEDPRMLRRYLAMLELQGTSYRDQMTLLAERQKQIQEQVVQWNATPEAERAALLAQFRESYAPQQRQVVQDATNLRENMETWLPLDVKVENEQAQAALTEAETIVQLTGESLRADGTAAGEQALKALHGLRETLPRFSEIQSTNQSRMVAYIANRLTEVESLITAHSGQMKIMESFNRGDFAKVAEIVEHRIALETVTLGEKLDGTEQQVASMSEEIAAKAELLNKIVREDIIPPQGKSVDQLAAQDIKAAEELLNPVVPAFALAEQTFDELMTLIIAKLDEAPAPASVGQPQGLDSLLALLEDEMKAAEGLGIPCRPINVAVMRDWMKPGSGSGQGMGQAQAQAAQGQAQKGKAEAERLEKQARESAQKALAQARKESTTADSATANLKNRGEAWNKLASRLQKDLLQGRDNTPPEQYRAAIENYFKIISDSTAEIEK